jgi:hypothetical protein
MMDLHLRRQRGVLKTFWADRFRYRDVGIIEWAVRVLLVPDDGEPDVNSAARHSRT